MTQISFEYIDDAEFLERLKIDSKTTMGVAPRGVTIHPRQPVAVLPDGFELQADVYYRSEKPAELRPALVFMHDWAGGKQPKICGDRQCNFLALIADIFCVTLYYRQPRDARYPAALKDLKTCLRWLRSIAGKHAIDTEKIIVMGSSAGTQWTWLAAAESDSRKFDVGGEYEDFSSAVNLAVINAGICDFVKDFGDTRIGQAIMGGTASEMPEEYVAASPLHQVRVGMPPVLMLHGEHDETCPLSSTEAMVQRLRELKVPVELVVRKGKGHGIGGFGSDLFDNLEVIRQFVVKTFRETS